MVFNSKVNADKITITEDKWARKSIVKINNYWNIAYKIENNLELLILDDINVDSWEDVKHAKISVALKNLDIDTEKYLRLIN